MPDGTNCIFCHKVVSVSRWQAGLRCTERTVKALHRVRVRVEPIWSRKDLKIWFELMLCDDAT